MKLAPGCSIRQIHFREKPQLVATRYKVARRVKKGADMAWLPGFIMVHHGASKIRFLYWRLLWTQTKEALNVLSKASLLTMAVPLRICDVLSKINATALKSDYQGAPRTPRDCKNCLSCLTHACDMEGWRMLVPTTWVSIPTFASSRHGVAL